MDTGGGFRFVVRRNRRLYWVNWCVCISGEREREREREVVCLAVARVCGR